MEVKPQVVGGIIVYEENTKESAKQLLKLIK